MDSFADGGDVESFDDRWAPTDDAVAGGQFDPQFENGSHWADEPGGDVSSALAFSPGDTPLPRSRPEMADVPTQGETASAPMGGMAARTARR
jgi:hypothetical protein